MFHIYCDFDATVTINDVWDKLFRQFGDDRAFKVWDKFNSGEYSAAQCILEACSTVKEASEKELLALFEAEPLRPGFIELIEFCANESIKLTVVSDGFSLYIRPIFAKYGIEVPYYANTVELTAQGTLTAEFSNARESCRFCGACKCGTILTTSADEDTIIYIGDGYSDHCPVEISDVIFARDMLAKFCSRENLPYHPFEDFFQVKDVIKKYLVERPKYKRLGAAKKRKELYKAE